MLDKLRSLSGSDFNKQYKRDQVSAHKDAVSLFQRYAQGGDDAALKDWAARRCLILSSISRWLRTWNNKINLRVRPGAMVAPRSLARVV